MPRIDPLLAAMRSNRADAVRLTDGDIARIIRGGTQHPLTRQPLGEGQLLTLLREMTSADVGVRLGGAEPVEFTYSNSEGDFFARVSRESGTLEAVVSAAAGKGAPANGSASNGSLPNGSSPKSPASSGSITNGSAANGSAMNGSNATPAAEVVALAPKPDQGAPIAVAQPPVLPATAPGPVAYTPVIEAGPQRPPLDSSARAEIERLLTQLVGEDGSDLHLRVGEPPILRVHGELKRLQGLPGLGGQLLEAMILSIMPDRNFSEFSKTNDTDFAHEIEGVARFRANAFRDHHGVGAVFRVIPDKVATVEGLGISPEVQNLCQLTKGLVLVTGPTGSGKSTTLGALIDLVNRSRDDHVITIEDPIEFVHKNKRCVITQRQVGLHTGSFKAALRAALREDPDIVLVGELRDLETISIAIETAETGHLVFGTLHTTTAIGTIDRIIDQFPADRQAQIRVMLADSLKAVISQTLLKKIGGGRVAAREILLTVPAVSNLIREGKAFQIASVMQTSRRLGMIQLGDVLIDLVDQGQVEPQEAYMKATDKTAFASMLKTRGHDVGFLQA
ncbi:MAG: PilT/PilU family type 4a pilus ATPase [Gemmatimonadaceae bacterium]